ncbi:trypsin-like serine protease [Anabaena sp. UHCC 0187]|uniref:trypsin-like serine protease n=1 Tax=Anabaena sp. UHCC 0187 TaxID=2590018 RepID=UPI0014464552|nr:trypsin-like serine protease [Anabaena sp. UHCC 0187]MTJ13925.1 trypsin-like serine protease [Anabaena sp. UHCC 0187]
MTIHFFHNTFKPLTASNSAFPTQRGFLYKTLASVGVVMTAVLHWSASAVAVSFTPSNSQVEYHKLPSIFTDFIDPLIVAGDPNGTPPDSPNQRIDPNTTTSPFAGVGSLFMNLGNNTGFLCSGAAISPRHILSAAHCLDANDDGTIYFPPNNVSFILNYGRSFSNIITTAALNIHPNFTGFSNPTINDDLAIFTLGEDLPTGVPIYELYREPMLAGQTLTMVGYGTTGDGVNGYYPQTASFDIKRVGKNNADFFEEDDEGSGEPEIFYYDFDGPDSSTNLMGGLTLGNTVETNLGGGDSGGPSFIEKDGKFLLAGVNTFGFWFDEQQTPGTFGTGGGGMIVSSYTSWIDSIVKPKSVPEPSNILGTLMIGVLGAGYWRKRQQKKPTSQFFGSSK